MSTSRKTIFELERRNNLFDEYEQVVSDFYQCVVVLYSGSKVVLIDLLNECIKTWPYRQSATSIKSFTESHGFFFRGAKSEADVIYSYELLLNLLHWAPKYCQSKVSMLDTSILLGGDTVDSECHRCLENIEYNLEMLNMRIRVLERGAFPQYVISKRDAQVDAVIESVPELTDQLLSYLDVRNQKDEDAKKAVLKALADYLEARHKTKYYKGTMYASLEDNIFTVFNKVGIRHGDNKQWKLRKPVRMKLYDQTFKAAIHLLQMEDVKAFNHTVDGLKQEQEAARQKSQNT